MGVAAALAPKGLGSQDPTKNLAHWMDLLGPPLYQKIIFWYFPQLHQNFQIFFFRFKKEASILEISQFQF